jgi:Zn-finger nucleic acid-binding protein
MTTCLVCPDCQGVLQPKMIDAIEVDYCEEGCKGIWFDEGELYKVIKLPKGEIKENLKTEFKGAPGYVSENTKRQCPCCKVDMERYHWKASSQIFLDFCPECYGFWLDKGELNAILKYENKQELERKAEQDLPIFKALYWFAMKFQ